MSDPLAVYSTQEIIALEAGAVPAFDPINSLARHLATAEAAIAQLDAGQEPAFPNGPHQIEYAADSGSANALSITPSRAPGAGDPIPAGLAYWIKVAADNTGAVTLDIGADAGALAVKKNGDEALETGDLKAGRIDQFRFDGTVWQWLGWRPDITVTQARVNTQTGASYTLALTDAGKLIDCSSGSAQAVTIPTNAAVAFPVDTVITVIQRGAGAVTVQGDTGVTLNGVSAGSATLDAQYVAVTLWKVATDTWVMFGAHGGVS